MTDKPEDKKPGHQPLVGFGLPPGRAVDKPAASAEVVPLPLKVPVDSNEATLDVTAIRIKTGLSQEEFADRYRFSKRTLQEWEQGRKRPTGAARSLLAVIRRHPKKVAKALAKDALGIEVGGIETNEDDGDE
jgi:DNA-binding XRE family transcriptional regulator